MALVFTALFFWASGAAAQAVSVDQIVKIYSTEQGSGVWREGSGVLVPGGETALVLTSSHVAYNSADKKYETYYLRDGKKLPLQWLASDWSSGLSLLRTEEKIALAPFSPSAQNSAGVRGLGFPHGETEPYDLEGSSARLVDSSLFFGVEKIWEISGLASELGMSGGALVNEAGGFLGILSHQRNTPEGMLTYAVPAPLALDWVKSVMAGNFRPQFLLEAQDIDGAELRLFGSGWKMQVISLPNRGAKISVFPSPLRPELRVNPLLKKLADDLQREGKRMKESLGADESPLYLNRSFYFVGFRPKEKVPKPGRIFVAKNGVEFLRHLLNHPDQAMFVNSGLLANYLDQDSNDFFLLWERTGFLNMRAKIGYRLFLALDELLEFERERYGAFLGLNFFNGYFTATEWEEKFFGPSMNTAWEESRRRDPALTAEVESYLRKALGLLQRGGFAFVPPVRPN